MDLRKALQLSADRQRPLDMAEGEVRVDGYLVVVRSHLGHGGHLLYDIGMRSPLDLVNPVAARQRQLSLALQYIRRKAVRPPGQRDGVTTRA